MTKDEYIKLLESIVCDWQLYSIDNWCRVAERKEDFDRVNGFRWPFSWSREWSDSEYAKGTVIDE